MTIGPGSLINGKYRLGRQLGEGGMGSIYEARHEFLGTEVALKFLHPALSSRPNVVARFVQEARVSANIKSPHVVGVVDVDQSPEGLAFLVMELLHGEPLSARLAREPVLPTPLACAVAIQVLLALEIAHGHGVVHRDMKPENVFLTDAPGSPGASSDGLLVKILDFGIAKLRTLGEVKAQLTRPGVVMGTPEYMAPEQVFAADAVDARADLYALGAMLFEMLAGRRPVHGEDPRAIAAAVMSGQTPRLHAVAPRVPQPISDVVAISLAPKPNDRFSSAAAMLRALVNACKDSDIVIDEPPAAALKSRSDLRIPTGANPVLGVAGLGVAPPAMLGPGDPAAMAAFDARSRGELPKDLGSGPPPVPEVAMPIDPLPATNPSEGRSGGETLAAMPSPYAPPVVANAQNDYSHSPSGTDAGFVPPYALDKNYGSNGSGGSLGSAPSMPTSTEVPMSRATGTPWLLVALAGLVVVAVVAVIVYAVRGSTPSAAPPPAPTATTAEEEDTPAKKKPKTKPDPTGEPEPSAKPTATSPTAPKPMPSPKPSVKPVPSPSPSVSTTATTKPPVPDAGKDPNIIEIPLPWPPTVP